MDGEHHKNRPQQFQTFVQWDDRWLNISVIPLKDDQDCLHYLVKLPNRKKFVLSINETGQWHEIRGENSPFIETLGEAIEYHYAICN